MVFGALFSFIFFHLGWSNAGKGIGVIKAFKQYKAERREMVVKTQNDTRDKSGAVKNSNKNNNKRRKPERKRVLSISMKEREAHNRNHDKSSATSNITSNTSTSQLKSGKFPSKILTGSNSNTANNSHQKIHIESDYDTEHEPDSDGSPIKRAQVTKDNSDHDATCTPAQETELQVLTVAAQDESPPLTENEKIKQHNSSESTPVK